MSGKIFINYRREDARSDAARIYDRLATAFGKSNVFMDVDCLVPGHRFDQELANALDESEVFLVVIGRRWQDLLSQRAQSGERDFVREEISAALSRGLVVIPVLLDHTTLPSAALLPPDLAVLAMHQKHDVRHERYGRDVEDLIGAIRSVSRLMPVQSPDPRSLAARRKWVRVMAIGLLAIGGTAALLTVPSWGPVVTETDRVTADDISKEVPKRQADREKAYELASKFSVCAALNLILADKTRNLGSETSKTFEGVASGALLAATFFISEWTSDSKKGEDLIVTFVSNARGRMGSLLELNGGAISALKDEMQMCADLNPLQAKIVTEWRKARAEK